MTTKVQTTESIVKVFVAGDQPPEIVKIGVVGPQGIQGIPGQDGADGTDGAQGPPGPPGGGNWAYIHDQMVPSDTWNIPHLLSGFPNVAVVDSAGRQVEGDVVYVDADNITVFFSAGFAGKAYLS